METLINRRGGGWDGGGEGTQGGNSVSRNQVICFLREIMEVPLQTSIITNMNQTLSKYTSEMDFKKELQPYWNLN